MATSKVQPWARAAWSLARSQHGVVARRQLLALGMPSSAVRHRLETGRLFELHRGVYAVGSPQVGRLGRLMAAVLACGPGAELSHQSGADLWGIRKQRNGPVDVVAPARGGRRRAGITLHRRTVLRTRQIHGIPVGDPLSILVDLATCLDDSEELEDAVNEADRRDLIATPDLRAALT